MTLPRLALFLAAFAGSLFAQNAETQPTVIEYNPGQKGLLWVRAACPDNLAPGPNLEIKLIRSLPNPLQPYNPLPDAEVVTLTGDLTGGNAWFPVYLR